MLEFLPLNKKKIYLDKLNLFNKNFLNSPLLKILDQDLIFKEKDLSPFWNKSCLEMSKKLPLPIMTDLQELDLNSSPLFVKNSIQNLPFSQIKMIKDQKKNLQMNSFQLLPTIHQNSMECVNTISNNFHTFFSGYKFHPTTLFCTYSTSMLET